MSNPHLDASQSWLEYSGNQNPEVDGRGLHAALLAQTEATLAVAFEARTANLIAALNAGFLLGYEHEDEAWANEIQTRLGLGDPK